MDIRYWGLRTLFVIVVLIVSALINHVHYLDVPEDGFLETTQVVVLTAVFLLWLRLCYRLLRRRGEEAAGLLSIGLGSAAVAFAGMGRELSWGEVYGASARLNAELKDISMVIFGLLLLACLLNWIFRTGHRGQFLKRYFTSRMWGWIAFAMISFVFADRFEHHTIPSTNPELYEEILELVTYVAAGWSAVGLWWRMRGRPDDGGLLQ